MNMRLAWLLIGGSLAVACGDDSAGTGDDSTSTGSTADDSTSLTVSDDDTSTSADSTTAVDSTGAESTGETSADTTQGATDSSGGSTDDGTTADGTTADGTTEESSGTEEGTDEGTTGNPVLPDITGDHLLAVSIVISPDTPLQYVATIVQTPDGDGALLDVELQPLTLDVGSTTDPRLPFGPPMMFDDVAVAADGTFSLSIPVLDVAGETNPITGSDAQAMNVVLDGTIMADDFWCGTVAGDLTVPLRLDLAGSEFAGTALMMGVLPNVFEWGC